MDRYSKKIFSRNIKNAREILNLSQEKFAVLIGRSRAVVSNWERRACAPSEETLAIIVRRCGIRKDYLLYGDGEPFT